MDYQQREERQEAEAPTTAPERRASLALWGSLVLAGLVLTATVVPAPFTLDEDHYLATVLALREGGVSTPGTGGLTPSRELLYFDPGGRGRRVESTPVTATAPPLYSFLALPFSYLGWRGLILLNTLAFLGTAALVFFYAARHARSAAAPWIAVSAFALGGYALEYAQGMWPHMLAVLLCTASMVLAARVRAGAGLAAAAVAGLLGGLAAGVRYQNVVFAAGVGLGLLLLAPRRLASAAAFGTGGAMPLLACSWINHARLGTWNPISKGPGYLSDAVHVGQGGRLLEIPYVLWVKVVDFAHHPPFPAPLRELETYLWREAASGAVVMYGGAKKAWLQSSPWIALGLVVLAAAWLCWPRRRRHGVSDPSGTRVGGGSGKAFGAGDAPPAGSPGGRAADPTAQRRELRAMALVVFPVLLVFGWAGFGRYDGLCFNQRYFHELVPLAAVALAFALDGRSLSRVAALLGALVAVASLGGLLFVYPSTRLTYLVLMNVPLALAVALLAAWLLPDGRASRMALSTALGLCIGWGLTVHVGDDVTESRKLRRAHGLQQKAVERALPDGPSALFAWAGVKVAHGPLQMERDLVIVDPSLDGGESAPRLVDDLLDRNRRVFVIETALPQPIFESMVQGHSVLGGVRLNVGEGFLPLTVYELGPDGARGERS